MHSNESSKDNDKCTKEAKILINSKLYKRLAQFEENIKSKGKFTRDDLGF